MKIKHASFLVFLLALILSSSCKKTDDKFGATTTIGNEFFKEGKGLRKIWGMKSELRGLGNFYNGHLTYTADGNIQMLFVYGIAGVNGSPATYDLYRKKINLNSGVATDLTFPNNTFNSASFIEQDGNCFLIPNTDKFAYRSSNIILGEPSWLPKSGFDYYVPKIYENEQIAQSNYLSYNQMTYASYYTNGVYTDTSIVIDAPNFCSSLELSTTGKPLLFTAGNPTLQVHNYATNTELASIPINLYTNYTSFSPQDAKLITKRSTDGTKIIGLILDNDHQIISYTTFIYDIVNNTFTKKIDDYVLSDFPLIYNGSTYSGIVNDFDEQGNIYYATTQGSSYQIKKVTPTNETVISSDFMTTGYVIKISAIAGKVFVVLSTSGNSGFSDDRGLGTLLVTVLE